MKKGDLLLCSECHALVEVLHPCECEKPALKCCGKAMAPVTVNGKDAIPEKHLPVVEPDKNGIRVRIGSQPHPMLEAHHVEWIEVCDGKMGMRKHLEPGEEPEACFPVPCRHGLTVRACCNLHGVWELKC